MVWLSVMSAVRPQKASRNQWLDLVRRRPLARIVVHQLIARQLLHQKSVVRLVLVECVDDVVAVFPGRYALSIVSIAHRIRIARNIQPMPAPLLSIMR